LSTAKALIDFENETTIMQYKGKYSTYNICLEARDAAAEKANYKLEVKPKSREKM
jgi:hypothetical protein